MHLQYSTKAPPAVPSSTAIMHNLWFVPVPCRVSQQRSQLRSQGITAAYQPKASGEVAHVRLCKTGTCIYRAGIWEMMQGGE